MYSVIIILQLHACCTVHVCLDLNCVCCSSCYYGKHLGMMCLFFFHLISYGRFCMGKNWQSITWIWGRQAPCFGADCDMHSATNYAKSTLFNYTIAAIIVSLSRSNMCALLKEHTLIVVHSPFPPPHNNLPYKCPWVCSSIISVPKCLV